MPFPLNHLLPELLEHIVAQICRGHGDPSSPIPTCIDPGHGCLPCDVERRAALRSLCLTSRRLYHVSLPHLYHHLAPNNRGQWWFLARTLAERPDLARYGRSLCFKRHEAADENGQAELWARPAIVRHFSKCKNEYFASLPETLDAELKRSEMVRVSYYNLPYAAHHLASDLLVSLLPNLETLAVVLRKNLAFRFCSRGSLPRLRHVRLKHSTGWFSFYMTNVLRVFAAGRETLETVVIQMCDPILPQTPGGPEQEAERESHPESGGEEEEEGEEEDDVEPDGSSVTHRHLSNLRTLHLPQVWSLSISNHAVNISMLAVMFTSFPNITHLRFAISGTRTAIRTTASSLTEILRLPNAAPALESLTLVLWVMPTQWEAWWDENKAKEFLAVMDGRGIKVEFSSLSGDAEQKLLVPTQTRT
ncbi:hypothetical protein VTJ04DRAFT_5461 [Mycothermus thermophilus]|uniref:uncharacterized protein n=1 Tax=Humicola insolens TaxID=85995 RepID=UPI0037445E25